MSSCCGGDAPQPPSPTQTAGAQTASNVSTAVANAFLNNVNQNTPQGSLQYDVTGNYNFTDPTTGSTYNIPTWTATQSLSPTQQQINDQSEATRYHLSSLANAQSLSIADMLANPLQFGSELPGAGDPRQVGQFNPLTSFNSNTWDIQRALNPTPTAAFTFGQAGDVTRNYGPQDNFSADRQRVEEGLMARMQPQLERDRSRLEQQLQDQGIRYGSPAYNDAMQQLNQQQTDARYAAIAQAGQEQQRLEQMAQQQAQFQNTAQQQAYAQAQGRGEFSNQAVQQFFNEIAARAQFANAAQNQQYQQDLGRGTFANAGVQQYLQKQQAQFAAANSARQQYLAEQYALRNQPINEITALMSGSQLQQPNWVSTAANQIPTTDVAGLINQNFGQQFQNFSAQQQAQSQLLGGLLGAAGSIGAGFAFRSDRRAKEDIHRMGTVFATEDNAGEDSERKKLPIYKFSYKDDPSETEHVGPMAQDVEKIIPAAVGKDRQGMRYVRGDKLMGNIFRTSQHDRHL